MATAANFDFFNTAKNRDSHSPSPNQRTVIRRPTSTILLIVNAFIAIIICCTFIVLKKTTLSPQQVYQKVNESIYIIHARKVKSGNVYASQASAVAVSDKLLATNCHAVDENVIQFWVQIDEEDVLGKIVKSYKTKDLCIIEVPGATFKPVKIRPTDDVKVGEDVVAIGSPQGLSKTISKGIISNKHHSDNKIFLQSDAPITHGSSGGGLFDNKGNLIGITTGGQSEGNLFFSIQTEPILKIISDTTFQGTSASDFAAEQARAAQVAKEAQAAREAQAAKKAKAARKAQAAKKAKAAREAQAAKKAKAEREARTEREAQAAREAQETQETLAAVLTVGALAAILSN